MPCALVDTAFPHSDAAMRLCRVLGEPLADALPVRLWCWGIDTDRKNGVFEADAKQLAQIVKFFGDSDLLLRAFVECEVIEPTGNSHEFRIKGWKINARFFKERKRLRKLRETHKRTRAKRDRDAKKTAHTLPLTPSPSPSKYSVNTHAREDEAGDGLPPKREIRPTRGFPEAAFETDFRELGDKAGITVGPFGNLEKSVAGKLIRRCGESKVSQRAILAEWWQPCWTDLFGWSLQQLEKHFLEVLAAATDPAARPKPKKAQAQRQNEPPARAPVPTWQETEARDKERERQFQEELAKDPPKQETIDAALRAAGVIR